MNFDCYTFVGCHAQTEAINFEYFQIITLYKSHNLVTLRYL